MRRILVFVVGLGLMTFATACGNNTPQPATESAAAALIPGHAYICSMHPESAPAMADHESH